MSKKASVVAIIGRTNVGKSSLFNAILGRRETVVAREPGTTRDSISVKAGYGGKDFWLVDTAGLKSPNDDFETSIQTQITEAAAAADVIIMVVEAPVPPVDEDRRVANLALRSQKPLILVVNKIDQNQDADLGDWRRLGINQILATSATQKQGIDELLESLAPQLSLVPVVENENKIRLSILGRPNVGKSSLFNALAAKQQALTSPQAGTTRDINRISVKYHGREIELADTAGLRRPGKIERGVEHFSVLRTLSAIEQCDVALVLMEVGEPGVALDLRIAGQVKEAGKGLILVVSKWDQLADKSQRQMIANQIADRFDFVPWAPLVFTSATIGQNLTKIFDLVLEITDSRQQRFKTAELNRWLSAATYAHPPAGGRGQIPKLKYMVQEADIDFPSFKIFGVHTKSVHFSYRRYLEKQFRANWPLIGTPIKFWLIEKGKSDLPS